jgi:hypothetical protein
MGLSGDTRRSYYDPDAGPRRWAVTSAFAGNGVAIAGLGNGVTIAGLGNGVAVAGLGNGVAITSLGNGVTIASVAMRTPSPKAP